MEFYDQKDEDKFTSFKDRIHKLLSTPSVHEMMKAPRARASKPIKTVE